jgi:hypothetical protein
VSTELQLDPFLKHKVNGHGCVFLLETLNPNGWLVFGKIIGRSLTTRDNFIICKEIVEFYYMMAKGDLTMKENPTLK